MTFKAATLAINWFAKRTTQRFALGRIVATPGALELAEKGVNLFGFLQQHATGQWGDIDPKDQDANEYAVYHSLRIWSAYETPHGRLSIITEADRTATTFLLADEY